MSICYTCQQGCMASKAAQPTRPPVWKACTDVKSVSVTFVPQDFDPRTIQVRPDVYNKLSGLHHVCSACPTLCCTMLH